MTVLYTFACDRNLAQGSRILQTPSPVSWAEVVEREEELKALEGVQRLAIITWIELPSSTSGEPTPSLYRVGYVYLQRLAQGGYQQVFATYLLETSDRFERQADLLYAVDALREKHGAEDVAITSLHMLER